MQLRCLNCGMSLDVGVQYCPKCDNDLARQHDGSTVTVDIAHSGETVREALQKLESELNYTRKTTAKNIRLVVGSGLIRNEVLLTLGDMKFRGDVKDFDLESANAGAILVALK